VLSTVNTGGGGGGRSGTGTTGTTGTTLSELGVRCMALPPALLLPPEEKKGLETERGARRDGGAEFPEGFGANQFGSTEEEAVVGAAEVSTDSRLPTIERRSFESMPASSAPRVPRLPEREKKEVRQERGQREERQTERVRERERGRESKKQRHT
jgi:hypothetical protein